MVKSQPDRERSLVHPDEVVNNGPLLISSWKPPIPHKCKKKIQAEDNRAHVLVTRDLVWMVLPLPGINLNVGLSSSCFPFSPSRRLLGVMCAGYCKVSEWEKRVHSPSDPWPQVEEHVAR